MRPTVVHSMGQFQTIHAARHLNVCKQHSNVRAGFQNGERLIGIHGFDRSKPGIFHDIDGTHAQHHLVLDHKHVGHPG